MNAKKKFTLTILCVVQEGHEQNVLYAYGLLVVTRASHLTTRMPLRGREAYI